VSNLTRAFASSRPVLPSSRDSRNEGRLDLVDWKIGRYR
jgi:hypothetical protein